MGYTKFLLLFLLLTLASCAKKTPEPIQVQIPTRPINYLHEVKPVLDKRCAYAIPATIHPVKGSTDIRA